MYKECAVTDCQKERGIQKTARNEEGKTKAELGR